LSLEGEANMLRKFWAWASTQLVTDVPSDIAACLDCGKVQCVEAEFRDCPNRLARAAALKAMAKNAPPEHPAT
jgi:hypothetical protein